MQLVTKENYKALMKKKKGGDTKDDKEKKVEKKTSFMDKLVFCLKC